MGVFCTAPAIRNKASNMITEIIGTFMLVVGILGINHANNNVGLYPPY